MVMNMIVTTGVVIFLSAAPAAAASAAAAAAVLLVVVAAAVPVACRIMEQGQAKPAKKECHDQAPGQGLRWVKFPVL